MQDIELSLGDMSICTYITEPDNVVSLGSE